MDSEYVGGSWDDSLAYFESAAGSEADSTTATRSALGFGFETSSDSATEGCFQPTTSQSIEGNFQHYVHLLRSMYTANEDTSSGNARRPQICNTGLIPDLVLPLVQSLLLIP